MRLATEIENMEEKIAELLSGVHKLRKLKELYDIQLAVAEIRCEAERLVGQCEEFGSFLEDAKEFIEEKDDE